MNYKIRPDDEYIDPEETLMDSGSDMTNVERPISGVVFNFLIFFYLGISGVYLINILKLQIISGDESRKAALQNISLSYSIPASRGIIYDRQGEILAYSVPDFELIALSRNIPKKSQELTEFEKTLSEVMGKSEADVHKIIEAQKDNAVISLEKSIDKSKAILISQFNLPGIYIVPMPKRIYKNGQYFSHVIGYINRVSSADLKKEDYYEFSDRIGRSGIESFYETTLRGTHGNFIFSREVPENIIREGIPGNGVVLNIDSEIQSDLYLSLFNALRSVGLTRAAAVAQNPQTGAVIGMVSFPSYDNNLFQGELTEQDAKNIFQNKNRPFLNRVIGGIYNPGSTIKPLLALAGLKEGVIKPETTITDTKGYIIIKSQFDPNIIYTYRDWKIQGTVNLRKAIANSSDIYFYSVGGGYGAIEGLGISKISHYLRKFLADSFLGIDLPGEQNGFVPDQNWKLTTKGESWYIGDTYNVSIGQGDLIVTPLWLNAYVSAIANGGVLFKPQVVQKIIDSEKKTVILFKKEEIGKLDFDKEVIDEVKAGMREVVVSGTGQLLASLPVQVGAKTGTAEVIKGKSANSLAMVFGPYQDPEIAVSIIIEGINHSQQGLALKAARDFLQLYFK